MAHATGRTAHTTMALLASGAAVLLAACGPPEPGSVASTESHDDLEYYYACGNEILEMADGRTFYPLFPEEQDTFDDAPYAAPAASAWGGVMLGVAAPGPGDDTGTLTIYEDGMAHWESDSGIEAWLTDEPQDYNWVC